MSGKYDEIENLSLSELKQQYYNCENNVQKIIIKKIFINKTLYEKDKIIKAKKEDELLKKQINEKLDNLILLKEISEKDKHIKKIKKKQKLEKEYNKEYNNILNKRGYMERYWETNQKFTKIDPKFKTEIEEDFNNNKIMERLNSELDFRMNDKKRTNIIKPYSDVNDGNYKDFKKYSIHF